MNAEGDQVLEGVSLILRSVSDNWDTPLTESQSIQLAGALGESGVLGDAAELLTLRERLERAEAERDDLRKATVELAGAEEPRRPWWRRVFR